MSNIRIRTLLIAAAAFTTGTTHAPLVAAPLPADSGMNLADFDANGAIGRAVSLMTNGRHIHARAVLGELVRDGTGLMLDDAQRARVNELRAACERRIRSTGRAELTIQKAELSLTTGDLLSADRHARSLEQMRDANEAQKAAGKALLGRIAARNAALNKRAPELADAALGAFEAGDHARAKSAIAELTRGGAVLDTARQQAIDGVRSELIDLEMARGSAFSAPMSMSLLSGPDEVTIEAQPVVTALPDEPVDAANYDPFDTSGFDPYEPMGQDVQVTTPELTQTQHDTTVVVGQPIIEPLDPIDVDQPGTVYVQPAAQPPADVQMTPFTPATYEPTAPPPAVDTTASAPAESGDVIEAARRFEAKSLLGEAHTAFDERRLNEALDKYNRVLNEFSSYLDAGDLTIARDRRGEVQVQLASQGGPDADVLTGTIGERDLERQRIEATFRNLISQANSAMSTGDTDAARDLAAQARLEVNRGRSVLSESDYESRIGEVENLIGTINKQEEINRIAKAERDRLRLIDETHQVEADRLRQRDAKIADALERVRSLQQELKYKEALQVVDQILFLDPTSPAGLLLRDVIDDTIMFREYEGFQEAKYRSYARHYNDNEEAMIAPQETFAYPPDWPAISMRRGQPLDFTENPATRKVMAALGESSLPIMFDEHPLIDVIGFIQANTGLNIDVDWTSLEDIGIDQEMPVNLRLTDVRIETVLDRVLSKVSDPDLPAGWAVIDGILTIASEEVLRRNTVLEIYDIRDLLFLAPYYTDAPAIDVSATGGGGGGRGGGGGQSPFRGGGGGGGSQDRENRDDRVTAITEAIQNNVDPDGWIDLGGDTGAIQELDGNLIITQTPRAHRQIVGMLNRLRETRQLQINVEARFLVVSEDFFEQIGLDLDVYLNTNNNAFQIAQNLDPSATGANFFGPNGELQTFFTENYNWSGFPSTTAGDTFIPILAPNQAGDQWSVISGAQNSFGIINSLGSAAGGFAADIMGANPALGITGRFLDDIQVDFMVEATQADRRSVTLTAPRLTFTNGQRAWVAVTTSQNYVSDLTPVTSDASVAFDPVISTIPSGVYLDVEGVVSADRRYVTLTVETGISEVSFAADRDFSGGAGGTGGSTGGGLAEGSVQIPITDSSQVKTTVTIPDQGTVLLGGQRLVQELEIESGVPVLNKIPVLSRFFSNRMDVKEQKTLLILLKPTIIIQDEEEEMNFPGLSDMLGT